MKKVWQYVQHTTTLVEIVAIRMQGARRRANGFHCFASALTHWETLFSISERDDVTLLALVRSEQYRTV